MALQRKPKTFKEWVEDCQPVTWLAHALITLAAGFLAALVLSIWLRDPWLFAKACTGAAGAYILKEIWDWIQHCRAGNLRKRDWQGISRLLDGIMDAGAPIVVAGTTWLPGLFDLARASP